MRTGSVGGDAEEITQEAMLLVWRKAAQFDASRASVSTWIYTIARNVRIDGCAMSERGARRRFTTCWGETIPISPTTR